MFENQVDNMATLPSGEIACNDDYCDNSYQSYISFIEGVQVFAGNTYYIVVDGYGGSSGTYEMNVYETDAAVTAYNIYRDGYLVGETSDLFMKKMLGALRVPIPMRLRQNMVGLA